MADDVSLDDVAPWALLILFLVAQVGIVVGMVMLCPRVRARDLLAWLRQLRQPKVTEVDRRTSLSNYQKEPLRHYSESSSFLNDWQENIIMQEKQNLDLYIADATVGRKITRKNRNAMNYCGRLHVLVEFGSVQKSLTVVLFKLEDIPSVKRGVIGHLHVTVTYLRQLQSFTRVFLQEEGEGLKQPWSITFDADQLGPEGKSYVLFVLARGTWRTKSTYVGSAIICLDSFYHESAFHNGYARIFLSSLPIDILLLKNSLFSFEEGMGLAQPRLLISMLYNDSTRRLEVALNGLDLPRHSAARPKDFKAELRLLGPSGELVGVAKVKSIRKAKNLPDMANLDTGGGVSFDLDAGTFTEHILSVRLCLRNSSSLKLVPKSEKLLTAKYVGTICFGRLFSSGQAQAHWKSVSEAHNSVYTMWHGLIY